MRAEIGAIAVVSLLGCGAGAPADEDVAEGRQAFTSAGHEAYPEVPSATYEPLKFVRVVPIVRAETSQAHRDHLDAFVHALVDVNGRWFQAMQVEYQLLGGIAVPAWVVPQAFWDTISSPSQKVAQVNAFLATQALLHGLAPNSFARTIYVLYDPLSTQQVLEGNGCVAGCHPNLPLTFPGTSPGDAVALVPDHGQATLDELTIRTTHEVAEAVTDTHDADEPNGGFRLSMNASQPWLSPPWSGEIGDLCAGNFSMLGTANFQFMRPYGSIAASKGGDPCIPAALPSSGTPIPYYDVSVDHDWYSMKIGPSHENFSIITGWSAKAVADWTVTASIDSCWHPPDSDTELAHSILTFSIDTSIGSTGGPHSRAINNGDVLWLHTHWNAGAQPDDVCILKLTSLRASDPTLEGDGHVWRLGVRALN